MDLSKVIFLSTKLNESAAVQIRCVDIARRLGCDFKLGVRSAEQIPDHYSVFVCMKTHLPVDHVRRLAQIGTVVWDIIDHVPPRENIGVYLASSRLAKHLFKDYGRVELIPHHHCNFEGTPNAPENRQPAWIGARHWLPKLKGFDYETHFVEGMSREDVVRAFRRTGIGLNLRGRESLPGIVLRRVGAMKAREVKRATVNLFNLHLAINSGIKLINCMGFGIPSVSDDEPAYHEIGEKCTIFCNRKNCSKWVNALKADDSLYLEIRQRCLRKAKQFHIDTIANKYKTLLLSL
jgi:hypothetical protein